MTIAIRTSGQPGWKLLTVLAALVVLAHALVLKASPAQLGQGPDTDTAGVKTLTTRSIDLPPSAQAAPPPAAVAKPAAVPQKARKVVSNKPVALANSAQAAPEIIAQSAALPNLPAPDLPTETVPGATPTLAVAALPAPAVAATATATAASMPEQSGPKTTPVQAVNLPGSVRLLYKVVGLSKNMNYQANAELAWKTNGDSYEAVMKVSAFLIGSRSMTSVGKITPAGRGAKS